MVTSSHRESGRRPLDCPADSAVLEDSVRAYFGHSFGFTPGYVRFPIYILPGENEVTDSYRWDPYEGYTGIASNQSAITHGTFFWHASREGCISKGTSVHGGLRTKLFVCSCLLSFYWCWLTDNLGPERLRNRPRCRRLHPYRGT